MYTKEYTGIEDVNSYFNPIYILGYLLVPDYNTIVTVYLNNRIIF